jgi:hypothetical protein
MTNFGLYIAIAMQKNSRGATKGADRMWWQVKDGKANFVTVG